MSASVISVRVECRLYCDCIFKILTYVHCIFKLYETGPACDAVCEPAANMLSAIDMQAITYGCVSGVISTVPNIVRTVAPYNIIGPFFRDFLTHYGWSRIAIITGQDLVWQTTGQYLRVLL